MRLSLLKLILSALVIPLAAVASGAPPESYFRSDGGVAPADVGPLPTRFDDPASLLWKIPMPSGQSSPVRCGDNIVLTIYDPEAKQLATVAVDRNSGKEQWRRLAPAAKIETFHPSSGNPAPATPAWDGERLYVFFGSYGLICYDAAGKVLWEHPLGPFRDEYGAGSSPVLVDDNVVLAQDHDIDSFLIAINRSTGKLAWKTPRPDAVRSYSTPAVWTHNGKKELLVAGALELAAYDPSTGEKLWWTHGLARIVIPIPVPAGDTIYMASWSPGGDAQSRIAFVSWKAALEQWDANRDAKLARAEVKDANVLDRFFRMDLDQDQFLSAAEWDRHAAIFRRAQNATLAIKPSTNRGELSEGDLVWSYPRGAPYVATPLLDRGVLWLVKDGGIVTKFEAKNGKVLSEERAGGVGSYYASPVAGDGKVYLCSEQGVLTVLANQPEWKILSSHDFKQRIHATPLIDGKRLYIRTDSTLFCFTGR